jgi:hypothetical protein
MATYSCSTRTGLGLQGPAGAAAPRAPTAHRRPPALVILASSSGPVQRDSVDLTHAGWDHRARFPQATRPDAVLAENLIHAGEAPFAACRE